MKRLILIMTALSLALLPGCGIYANYREVEELLVLQTMGLDYMPGGVHLSLSAAAESSPGTGPVRLEGRGGSITDAIDRARGSSFEQELFFSNIDSLLIGQKAAETGVGELLSYVCQSPVLRVDIPMYIVKNGTAADCVRLAGDSRSSITDILQGIQDSLEKRGESRIFTASEVISSLLRHGSALVCTLELSPSSQNSTGGSRSGEGSQNGAEAPMPEGGEIAGDSGPQQEEQSRISGESPESPPPSPAPSSADSLTAAISGFAVLRDKRLCAMIGPEQALGVGLLIDHPGVVDLEIKDAEGKDVTVQVNGGGCRLWPVWGAEGRLRYLDIRVDVLATVLEIDGQGDLSEEGYADYLTAELEKAVSEQVNAVLALSKELEADFLGLGSRVELRSPVMYRALGDDFARLLPEIEMRVTVSGQLSHTNDIKDTWT